MAHKDIFIPFYKETHFFNRDKNYRKGLKFYSQLFNKASGRQIVGEGSPQYTMAAIYPEVSARIARDLPDVKLIYIVRDPIKRMESLYNQELHRGLRPGINSFGSAVMSSPESYIDPGRYWLQISHYLERFDSNKIRIVFMEEFVKNPLKVANDLFAFLEVPRLNNLPARNVQLNRSVSQKQDRAVAKKLRESKRIMRLYSQAIRLMPSLAGAMPKNLYRKPLRDRAYWEAELYDYAHSQLYSDAKEFLRWAQKSDDYWSLEPTRLILD